MNARTTSSVTARRASWCATTIGTSTPTSAALTSLVSMRPAPYSVPICKFGRYERGARVARGGRSTVERPAPR